MMSRNNPIKHIATLVAWFCLSACILQLPFIPQSTPAPIESSPTPTGAVVPAIRVFISEPELNAIPVDQQTIAFGKEIQIYTATLKNGERARFEMDTETGEVIGFYLFTQFNDQVSVDHSWARQAALDFAKAHYKKFDQLDPDPISAQLVDHGSYKTYEFVWLRTDSSSGAYLPQEVVVWISPQTGQVINYLSKDVEVTTSTQPIITHAQAVEIARSTAPGFESTEPYSAVLFVSTLPVGQPKGEQALLWNITWKGDGDQGAVAGVSIYLNALSGKIEAVESYAK
ncbi:MAG: hypothetical protein JW862_16335 [Anaerolineales bacterium]|nr:hypothetical protein [Anaerolineales bacterium]